MSDYDFPELPSDEELGITDEDREQFEKDFPDDGPEMSDKELAALLGEAPRPSAETTAPSGGPPPVAPKVSKGASGKPAADPSKARAQASREVRKAEKKQTRDEAKAAREAARHAKAEAKARAKREKADARRVRAEARKKASKEELPVPAWRGPTTLLLLLLFGVFSSSRTGIPGPMPVNAPDTAFSSGRAMATLVDLAREAHPTGSPEHARVRQLLVDRLAELGVAAEVQTTTSMLTAPRVRVPGGVAELPDFARAATVRNVVARIPGTASTGTVLVTAHYDSREIAVGAADDGSGVVTILEAVRAIRADAPLENDLVILFTDAEELGLLGARAFVDQHRWMDDVDLVLSFEMRGAGGPSIMFETNESNGWVVQALADFDPAPVAYSLAYEVYRRMPNDTDFTPFREAGVQGMNFAAIDNAHVYHQVYDTPENLAESTLQHHGLHALSALRYFGNADLSAVNAPNRVYFSVAGLGLVTYPPIVVHLLSALLVGLFCVFVVVARRGGARPAGALASLILALAVGAGGWVAATMLRDGVADRHPELGALHGSLFHGEGWYVLAMAVALLSVLVGVVAAGRRWLSRDEIALGAFLVPIVAAVALGIVAPLGAVHLQVPALAAVLAALTGSLLGGRVTSVLGWVASLLLALPVFLLLQPVVELVWLALTLQLFGVVAVLMTLGVLLLVPAYEGLRAPNVWWAPAALLVFAGLSFAMGIVTSGPNADRPRPTTLLYAYEHGSGEALWVTGPAGDESEGSASRTWAEARAGGTFDETRDLAGFGYLDGVVPVRRAPVVSATPPLVNVLSDSIIGSERTVLLDVRSMVGAERLGFQLGEGTVLRAMNGMPLENADAIRRADHWGEPDGAVRLELTMPASQPIGLHVVEHLLRPEEILGDDAFQRAADLAPNVNRLSDRVMLRYSVAAFADPRHAFLQPAGGVSASAPSDTLVIRPAPGGSEVDTLAVGTTVADTLVSDTLVPDTVVADSLAVDTLAVDTFAVDTLAADAPSADTLSGDPSVPDTTTPVAAAGPKQPVFARGSR